MAEKILPAENDVVIYGDGTEGIIVDGRSMGKKDGEPMTRLVIRPGDYLMAKNGLTRDDLDEGDYLIMDYPNKLITPLDIYSQTKSAFLIWCSPLKKETNIMKMMRCTKCNEGYPTFFDDFKSAEAIMTAQERTLAQLRRQLKEAHEKLFTKEFIEELSEKIASKVASHLIRNEPNLQNLLGENPHG